MKTLRVIKTNDERVRRRRGHAPSHPDSIPWSLIELHREQAERNHYQTIERLQERGGLSVVELYCVLNNMHWNDYDWDTDYKVVGQFLFDKVAERGGSK